VLKTISALKNITHWLNPWQLLVVLCNFRCDSVNDAVLWPMTSDSGAGTNSMLTTANYVSATVMQLNASTMTHLTHSLWTTIVVEVGCVWTVSIERQADSATRVRLASSGLMARAWKEKMFARLATVTLSGYRTIILIAPRYVKSLSYTELLTWSSVQFSSDSVLPSNNKHAQGIVDIVALTYNTCIHILLHHYSHANYTNWNIIKTIQSMFKMAANC